MSCSCNCNPCSCEDQCDPANEPLSSALNNFIISFFGTITKSCVDGSVVWALPCDLDTEAVPGFPRVAGEGVACYLARIMSSINQNGNGVLNPLERYVYLVNNATDQVRMGGVAEQVYTTIQESYDAANALAVAGGFVVNIIVHTSSIGQVGDLNLTADYNGNVRLHGYGGSSLVGNWFTNGFTIPFVVCNRITFESIDLRNIGAGTSGSMSSYGNMYVIGGILANSTSGDAGNVYLEQGEVGGLVDASSTSGFGGAVSAFGGQDPAGFYSGVDAHSTVSNGGYITINQAVMGGICDLTSPTQSGYFVSLQSSTSNLVIDSSSPTGSSGLVVIDGHGPAGQLECSIKMACPGLVGYVQLSDTRILGVINLPVMDIVGLGSKFHDADISASTAGTDESIIEDLAVDDIVFVNCVFIPSGAAFSIDATVPRNVRTFDLKDRNGFGANVTSIEGVHTTSPNMIL